MIDISDGVSSDLNHLIDASGVGAVLYAESIPVQNGEPGSPSDPEYLERALHGGEDFELLFTADQKKISSTNSLNFSRIGEVTANEGIIELIADGETRVLKPKGYRHF
jgi:thiamine-monophosphate kinase